MNVQLKNDEDKAQWLDCLGAATTMVAEPDRLNDYTMKGSVVEFRSAAKDYAERAAVVADALYLQFQARCT
jgi:hypothetical protein